MPPTPRILEQPPKNRVNDIAILNVILGVDFRCITNGISQSETVNLLQNANLTQRKEVLQKQTRITRKLQFSQIKKALLQYMM